MQTFCKVITLAESLFTFFFKIFVDLDGERVVVRNGTASLTFSF